MTTFYLETEDIIKITGQRFYKRGLDYYKKGRVHRLSYNQSIDSWSAVVKGAQTYHVRIFFFEHDDLEAKCNCSAYETHFTCKHIAAVLLAISHQQDPSQSAIKEVIAQPTDPFPLRMIEIFEVMDRAIVEQQTTLQMDYTIIETKQAGQQEPHFKVALKCGMKQLYIVKDIQAFILAIKQKQSYSITDKFMYHPTEHKLTTNDLSMLDLINQAIGQAVIYADDYFDQNKREVIIPPFLINRFLSSLESCSYQLIKEDGTPISKLILHDRLSEIKFPIQYDNNLYHIDFSDLFSYRFYSSYGLLMKQSHVYPLTTEQKEVLAQIYRILPYRQKHQYLISRNKMAHFIGHVLPKLEQLGTTEFSPEAKETIEQKPLQIKLFIEEIKQTLSATVVFQYGQVELAPFQAQTAGEKVLARDFKKENELIQTLKASGFYYLNQRFQLFSHDHIYQFVNTVLPQLKEQVTVYLSKEVQALTEEVPSDLETYIQMDHYTGMLDVQFKMDGISKNEIQLILQALIEKQSFHRLESGTLLKLNDDRFKAFQSLVDQLHLRKKDVVDGHIELPTARSFQVKEALDPFNVNYSQAFQQLMSELNQTRNEQAILPTSLKVKLRDYQQHGFNWFKSLSRYRLGGILADEMGLGKTVQAISFIVSEKEKNNTDKLPSLILVPASLMYNWKKEYEKFAPNLKVKVMIGPKAERKKAIEKANDYDILITSYPLLRQDIALYDNLIFDIMILDEAQAIKNHLTLTAKATRRLKAKLRFALTGTPIENRLNELWSIFNTISPGFLGSKQQFSQYSSDYIKKITRPFILRRLKAEVLPELPEKIEFEQYAELTIDQKHLYLAYLEQLQQQVDTRIALNQFEQGKLELLTGLTRLRQICCHPQLFLDDYQGESGKLELLKTLLEQLYEQNRRVLIFSQFSSMLQLINQELTAKSYQTFYLDGQTPAKQRVEMADAFNNGERDLFLISLKAGGTGLNLTGADTVILYDLWWNPAIEAQAAGRAHRIGQTKNVEVIRLITEGTIEEKIFRLQEKKRQLVDEIIEPNETLLSSLNQEDLQILLSYDREID
ncbi:DEAD/DEAH box helicase [Amphibacillus sediminis]|uniref:DEAD/DEAH box helicase n=1 Tax=Amphibacillus sediminis TaxID=360185 RepID=UPI00083403CF|nr:DEAD/DEAH box helicase [Amphibacillus sediminis]